MINTNILTRIVYVSTATDLLPETELQQILKKSRSNNEKSEVTGLLLYSSGNILQILEGDETILASLYKKISQDHRHFGIIKLQQTQINHRAFTDWSMGFKTISADEFGKVKGYIDINNGQFNEIKDADPVIKDVLEMFITNNK